MPEQYTSDEVERVALEVALRALFAQRSEVPTAAVVMSARSCFSAYVPCGRGADRKAYSSPTP